MPHDTLSSTTGSPAIPAAPATSRTLRRIIVASVLGNALEWYDFFLYGTAAALIFGPLFFPLHGDPLMGTLAAFAGFAIGFLARPLGGIVFGHIGDRHGRKRALVVTLMMMGVATFGIGLLPTFSQIGFLAPAALVCLRIVQGIASGGEWGGGVLLISESAPANRRGYYASFSQLGVAGGFVLSAAAFYLVQRLPVESFMSWGWRVPFLASVLIFGVGVYIRRSLPESRDFAAAKPKHMPVLTVLRNHPKQVLQAMGLRVAENGGTYIFLSFVLVYGKTIGVPVSVMLGGVMIAMLIELVTIVLWGRLSDVIGRRPVYMIGALGLVVIAFPAFWLIDTHEPLLVFLSLALGLPFCHGAMIGTQPALMGELFPTEVRYSGMALGHEIASVFSGGLAPLVAIALYSKVHASWSVALMLIGFGLITAITLATIPKNINTTHD
ncbi:MFS transporter [Paraburkholderia sp. 1N]|uniref:MFS transporter n=1 Tax=Paraburkholderia solitsugae TaxID=2675748 RepID=A0ABX2BQH8_9BURK|nr:MFS transporter [Paraburkholderia solitsugae]NPT42981.1 MFS transporter [Paraburkholderia solitsugae]